jgi:hypothetical protein
MLFPDTTSLPSRYSTYSFDIDNGDRGDIMEEDRLAYLTDSAAVPTPLEAMALWVAVWEAQGGKTVEPYNHDYNQPQVTILDGMFKGSTMSYESAKSMGIPDDMIDTASEVNYASLGQRHWTPARTDVQVPAGYGSCGLELFMVVDETTELRAATNDNRRGWEWGHTRVFTLSYNGRRFVADTNEDYTIRMARDVVELARTASIDSLAARLLPKQKPAVMDNFRKALEVAELELERSERKDRRHRTALAVAAQRSEQTPAASESFFRRLGKLLGL